MEVVSPIELGQPRGFSHGILSHAGPRMLAVAGQTATDASGAIAATDFAVQFDVALARVLAVVREAGGDGTDIIRLTVYVTDLDAYRRSRSALRGVWQRQMGAFYPAMTLVQVAGLVDEGALVEIEADAALP